MSAAPATTCAYVAQAVDYAESVQSGKQPACLYVQQACARFLGDLKRSSKKAFPYELDQEETARRCDFLSKLPHVKGKWARDGQRLELSPWQVFCTVNLFGWKSKATGRRRFREGYIEVPRKNGKSFWAAAMGNSVLCQDADVGVEVGHVTTSHEIAHTARVRSIGPLCSVPK